MKKENGKRQEQLLRHDREFLDQGFLSLAGVDEAGRGPLAGPVVASAVIVRDFSFRCRIDDSKKLSGVSRAKAYDEILQKCTVALGIIEHRIIDEINIFQATMRAMEEAVTKLGTVPDCVLVDGPALPKIPMRQVAIVNGDATSFSIACASIVAKVTRDRMMDYYDTVYPGYGFARHKGYGTRQHVDALKEKGPCGIHRRSFEPVKSLTAPAAGAPEGRIRNYRKRFYED